MSSQISEQDQLLLVNSLLPTEVGLFRQKVSYTCLHVVDSLLAVGSEQGVLWIIDTHARKIIKEIQVSRVPLKAIQLSSKHTFVATGSANGVTTIINYLKPSIKQLVRDKESISTMMWNTNGDKLFVGYSSGKLVSFSFNVDTVSIETTPLLECGSLIFQLSLHEPLLLISTQDRPLLFHTDTGKLTQVGTRERKPGPFGGCFISSDSIVVARPGLRLWIADQEGKVQSTAKFRDVFSSSTLPPMPLYGGIATPTTFSDVWQFGMILPWKNEWVIGYCGNTVWVLEPRTLTCVGTMTLGQKILDVEVDGNDLYLLLLGHQRLIVKLSLPQEKPEEIPPHCVTTGDKDTEKQVKTCSLSTENLLSQEETVETKNKEDERTVMEEMERDKNDEKKDKMKGEQFEGKEIEMEKKDKDNENADDDKTEMKERNEEKDVEESKLPLLEEEKKIIVLTDEMTKKELYKEVSTSGFRDEEDFLAVDSEIEKDDPPISKLQEEEKQKEEKDKGSTNVLGAVETHIHHVTDLRGILSQPLGKLASGLLNSPTQGSTQDDDKGTIEKLQILPLSNTEVERRTKMLEVDENDDTDSIVVHTHTRKTKKRKAKRRHKHTPLSSTHSSLERLAEIVDEEEGVSPLNTPPIEHTFSGDTSIDKDPKIEICISDSKMLELVQDASKQESNSRDIAPVDSVDSVDSVHQEDETDLLDINYSQPKRVSEGMEDNVPQENRDELWNQIEEEKCLVNNENEMQCIVLPNESRETKNTSPGITRGRANAFFVDPSDLLFQPSVQDGEKSLFDDDDDKALMKSAGFISSVVTEQYDVENVTSITVDETPSNQIESHRSSHSYSMSSVEENPDRPLCSDTDSEDEMFEHEKRESVMASDFYSLVGKLVDKSEQSSGMDDTAVIASRRRVEAPLPVCKENEDQEVDVIESHTADIWNLVPQPSHYSIQSMCLSSTSLWLINSRNAIYWSNPSNGGRDWQGLKKPVSYISSSANGKIVWGVYHHQAYARQGISEINPTGAVWYNVTRNSHLSKSIKWVSCDHSSVWAITTDSKVLFRKGVCETFPEGKIWIEVKPSIPFVQIACCNNIVWGLDCTGKVYVRESISGSHPAGREWKDVKSPLFAAISVVDSGIVWGIDFNSRLWFRCGASIFEPEGGGPWWEVAVGSISKQPPSSAQSLWQVISIERSNSILQSVTSLMGGGSNRFLALSACAQSGICLLTHDNQLHACWKVTTGYTYEPACTDDLFSVSCWKQISVSNISPWIIRDDEYLFCLLSSEKAKAIECQGPVSLLTTSPSAVWVLTKDGIWSRQGLSEQTPEGYSWEFIELGTNMQDLQINHLAIGTNVAWAVDHLGHVHFRFGIHPREPGTGMSPAWIQVDNTILFKSIVVSPDDWLVWTFDKQNCAYVRKGVTSDFPVGTSWEVINGQPVKDISAACGRIFALSLDGEVLCRQGITESNPAGNYWRKLPGKFDTLSASPSGELWLIGEKGAVMKQKSKVVAVHQENRQKEKDELEMGIQVEGWEVI